LTWNKEIPSYSSPTIIHLDADAFFASCEQAVHPEYRGKPVITGKERGIVSAASYEAKALGIGRGTPLFKVKQICPQAIIVPSDYETYSLFSRRIFAILRRFTPVVEEYSIDEAFADISGLRRHHKGSYEQIAARIKSQIEKELGITVSIGLATTKVLAKLGSKWQKPSGLTTIYPYQIPDYLEKLSVEKIWGIGPQTTNFLSKYGIKTALNFIKTPEDWIKKNLTKPHVEIWHELRGTSVYTINTEAKDDYASISKFRTFTPPSKNKDEIFSQLSKNLENAFIKARRHNLSAKKISIALKTQEFKYDFSETKLNRTTILLNEIIPIVRRLYEQIYCSNVLYRSTGVVISQLTETTSNQLNLSEDPLKIDGQINLFKSLDELSLRYGKHTVFLGSSFIANTQNQHQKGRGEKTLFKKDREKEIFDRKFIGIPSLGDVN
jgi:DNA polymerase-4/DNA polymerase V